MNSKKTNIVSKPQLRAFWNKHHEAKEPLERWYNIAKNKSFSTFADIKNTWTDADKVDKYIVFNIGGNKYRLITKFAYKIRHIYIRAILTHKEYDKGKWKE